MKVDCHRRRLASFCEIFGVVLSIFKQILYIVAVDVARFGPSVAYDVILILSSGAFDNNRSLHFREARLKTSFLTTLRKMVKLNI